MSYLERLKRELPLNAVKALELDPNSSLKQVQAKEGDTYIVRFEERLQYSDFYFEIVKYLKTNKGEGYNCKWKPRHSASISEHQTWLKFDAIPQALNTWADLVAGYHTTKNTPFDDPAVAEHRRWYSNQIQLVEENSGTPFTGEALVLLSQHYETLIETVKSNDGLKKGDKEALSVELESEKSLLGTISKKEAFERLLTLWAKLTKKIPSILKHIKNEFQSWCTQKAFDGTFQAAIDFITG